MTRAVAATVGEILDRIRQLASTGRRPVLVAVAGRGGSGKTTLAGLIQSAVPDVTVVQLDDFARPAVPGWDWARFTRDVLEPVLGGRTGRYQRWDWPTDRAAEWHEVPTTGLIVVEGVSPIRVEIGDPWHLTVWVDAPYDVRLRRGVERDGEALRSVWTERWMPEEDAYVAREHPDERADVWIDGTAAWETD